MIWSSPQSDLHKTYSVVLGKSSSSPTIRSHDRTMNQTPLCPRYKKWGHIYKIRWYWATLMYKKNCAHSFPPWICAESCSSPLVLAGVGSCDQSGNRTLHCPLHYEPHRQSTQKTKAANYSMSLLQTHIFYRPNIEWMGLAFTLQFCSQKDLGMNWTGRWVLMSRGVVGSWSATSWPSWRGDWVTD